MKPCRPVHIYTWRGSKQAGRTRFARGRGLKITASSFTGANRYFSPRAFRLCAREPGHVL